MDQATAESIDSADVRGLSAADVAERVSAGQTNAFTADSSRSAWNIVRANVFTLFNAIVAACFLVLLLTNLVSAFVCRHKSPRWALLRVPFDVLAVLFTRRGIHESVCHKTLGIHSGLFVTNHE